MRVNAELPVQEPPPWHLVRQMGRARAPAGPAFQPAEKAQAVATRTADTRLARRIARSFHLDQLRRLHPSTVMKLPLGPELRRLSIEFDPKTGLPVRLTAEPHEAFKQYHSIDPCLDNPEPPPEKERLQSPAQRDKLNGSYECILCGCCSSQCPSFWWNPDKCVGPAGLLQAYRFIVDSRDDATQRRLDDLNDAYRLFRCRTIMNCSEVCPKGLEPSHAIEEIRLKMSTVAVDRGGLEVHRPISPK